MRIVIFGTYQADSHPRIRVLAEGLAAAGHEVTEINEPLGMTTADRVSMLQRPWTVPLLAGRLLTRWARLWRRGRAAHRAGVDAVLVGYLGHFDVHLARRVFGRSTPIALDHLIFAQGTAVDRGAKRGLITRALGVVDRSALSAADVIVLDTAEHAARVPARLAGRVVVCLVGADHRWFAAGNRAAPAPLPGAPVQVAFFGLYTPLQGARTIGEALGLIADRTDIVVTMIGTGQDLSAAKSAAGAADVQWRDWIPADELPAVVAAHHVALGIFGATLKAAEVVPNKMYQSAAAGCAIITSDTAPQRRVLGTAAVLVPAGDANAIASALIAFADDRALLADRRLAARRLADAAFKAETVAAPLVDRLLRWKRPQRR